MTKEKIRTIKEITTDILNYFEENEDTFTEAIEELDSYNGYLGDDRYYDMDELDVCYCDTLPSELLARAFFGYDEDSWNINERGERVHHNSFNPNRNYFKYNGYGNLVSTDYKDYSCQLDEYAIFSMLDNIDEIDAIGDDPELQELFEELQAAYDEQEA